LEGFSEFALINKSHILRCSNHDIWQGGVWVTHETT